jgi:hypothetical protein
MFSGALFSRLGSAHPAVATDGTQYDVVIGFSSSNLY